MALKMFEFIDDIIDTLEEEREYLERVSCDIEKYFEDIIRGNCDGYININTRVKSSSSLKEKILRNTYYNKKLSPRKLVYSLSDLIGIRIECRFIKDEDEIYKMIKEHFNYINNNNENIFLEVTGIQPQKQKNGFEIYRIDGFYKNNYMRIPFELQIKSLVNIFWSEIEHKIIYKNNSYLLIDSYLKDIMKSIKKNLMMIDNQLFVTYNQFNVQSSENYLEGKNQFEKFLSKIIYDTYALKMKKAIGFVVDFTKPCDIIVKYFLRSEEGKYGDKMLKILERLNEIYSLDTKFDEEILFERDIKFIDEFTEIIGSKLLESINNDFQWNLFFRIIFEVERGNNAEDFEAFIEFYRNRFSENTGFSKLKLNWGENEATAIKSEFMGVLSKAFIEIDSIQFIIENNIEDINNIINTDINNISKNINSYEEWKINKEFYLKNLYINILDIFNI